MLQPKNWRKWTALLVAALPVVVVPGLLLNTTASKPEEKAHPTEALVSDSSEPPSIVQPSAAPTPTPTPKPSTMPRKATQNTASVEQWRELVSQYPWPVDEALAVMKAESGGNPRAVSPTNDHGLLQINWRWQKNRVTKMGGSLESLYDPAFNVQVAYAIYAEQGWCPWYAARKIGVAKGCN